MKKVITAILTAAAIANCIPVFSGEIIADTITTSSYTNESGDTVYTTEDGFEYTIANDEITITKYTGDAVDLTIPDYIDGLPVTLLQSTFENNNTLENVTMPDTLKKLSRTFYNCSALKHVQLNEGLTILDNYIFSECISLEEIILPSTVEKINMVLFYTKENTCALKSIKILNLDFNYSSVLIENNSITNVDIYSYENKNAAEFCKRNGYNYISLGNPPIKEMFEYEILEDDTIAITNMKFKYAVNLDVPESIDGYTVTEIRCNFGENLEKIRLPNTIKTISGAFYHCENLESIKLPNSIEYLGDYVFAGCRNIKNIELPNNLKTLGDYAFDACINLKNINFPNTLISVGDGCFSDCKMLEEIMLPDSVTSIGTACFVGCISLNKLKLPKSTTTFPCVETVSILNTCEGVEYTAYDYSCNFSCPRLEKIVIPEGFEILGECTFDNCNNLKYVVLPKSLSCWKLYTNTAYTAFSSKYSYFDAILYCYPDSLIYKNLQKGTNLKYKIIGDISGNDEIDSSDALALLNAVVGNSEKTDDMEVCDFDYDGQLTSADALKILNYIVGNIDSLY